VVVIDWKQHKTRLATSWPKRTSIYYLQACLPNWLFICIWRNLVVKKTIVGWLSFSSTWMSFHKDNSDWQPRTRTKIPRPRCPPQWPPQRDPNNPIREIPFQAGTKLSTFLGRRIYFFSERFFWSIVIWYDLCPWSGRCGAGAGDPAARRRSVASPRRYGIAARRRLASGRRRPPPLSAERSVASIFAQGRRRRVASVSRVCGSQSTLTISFPDTIIEN